MGPLWRRVFLVSLLLSGLLSGAVSDDIGGSYYRNHTISLLGSPYNVTNEIIVGEAATLTIEAGVRLLFPEGVGMTVWGRLIAVGTPADRIVFDRKRNPPEDQANNVARDHDIRLLGPTVFEGRVQVKRDGRWGSLCQSRMRNSEATVVCRQLGFANGRVDNKYQFGTGRMAVCNLRCRSNENNIYECSHDSLDQPPQCPTGQSRRDLGVVCEGVNNRGGVHWKGMDIRTADPLMYSVLENVDVLHGGATSTTAAIVIRSVSPKLQDVVVKYSGQAAINVANPSTPFQMSNCDISDNHGVGLLVSYPSQNITVSSTSFARNFPAGMHVTGAQTTAILSINRSTFSENSGAGLMLTGTPMWVAVNDSMFNANSHYGLSISSSSVTNLECDGCHFDHNGLDGVHVRYTSVSSESSITVMRNSEAEGNGGRGLDLEISYNNGISVPLVVDQVDISGSEFLSNADGSVRVAVDGSDESHYPSILVTDGIHRNNTGTILEVSGTYTELTVENSLFESNECGSKQVIYVHGFEKEIRLSTNRFTRNVCKRVGLYSTTGISLFSGSPPVEIVGNIFDNNEYNTPSHAYISEPLSEFCTLEFSGSPSDAVNVTRNSFQSETSRLEICSNGQDTGVGETTLQASLNWWGTTDPASIANKIFDYDDWNDGAIVTFVPYLDSPSGTPITSENRPVMSETQLGGRLFDSLRLTRANSPYTITRDLTILPNASLIIDPGVDIQIQERVGILNLGHMEISGTPDSPTNFNLTTRSQPNRTDVLRLQDGSSGSDGRLEVYHQGQWMGVCRQRVEEFTDIACRQLGLGQSKTAEYLSCIEPKVTVRCEGHEEILEECSFYRTTSCSCTRLTCEPTLGWGGVRSYSSEPVNISNINLQYVGRLHHGKASALSVQNHPFKMLFTEINMTDFVRSRSGIEVFKPEGEILITNVTMESCATETGILVLDPQQSVTLRHIDLTNTGSKIDAGIGIKKLDSSSWSNLEEQVGSRLVSLQSMYGGPPIINLRPGMRQWLVNGRTWGVKSSSLKNIQAPYGYTVQLNVTKSDFDYYPSDNSLTVYDSSTRNDSRVLGRVDYYNDDPSGTESRVFTSSGSMLTLYIKAEQGRDSFFLAEVKAVPDTDVSTLNNIDDGLYLYDVSGDVTLTNVSMDNNGRGLYLSSVSGDVTLKNVSALGNNNNGMHLSSITGAVAINDAELHSNNGHGLALENFLGTSSLSDVTATGNGASSYAGVYIYQMRYSSGRQASYNIENLKSKGNRGHGVRLELAYESSIDIFNCLIQENLRGGVAVNIGNHQPDKYPQIALTNNTMANNTRFALQATGRLANFEISRNLITHNVCPYQPAVRFQGQPKHINFRSNSLIQNNARETFSVLFGDESQTSEKVGILIEDNVFNENFYSPSETGGNFQYGQYPDLISCTIEIGGYKANYSLTHNLIDNKNMNYTLCSRVGTTFPDEAIDAKYNWWGTVDEQEIRNKIVDFDDWNDRAPVSYFPYLTGPDVTSLPAEPSIRNITMTTDDIGGRLNEAMHLTKSGTLPSVYRIANNIFKDNSGTVVKVTAKAPDSTVDVLRNIFENNQEREANNDEAVITIHGNVFTNPANDAELATSDRMSSYPVNATGNFWGFSSAYLVSRRIRDRDDYDNWADVLYDPWVTASPGVPGACPLGWRYNKQLSACYMYHGGSHDWLGAVHSCKIQHAIVAKSFSGQERQLIDSIIRAREVDFASDVPIWKDRPDNKIGNSTHECEIHVPSNGSLTTFADCGSLYPFICKRPVVDDCPNACSHHGGCLGRTCICDRGWEGEDCSKANCGERNDCGEFGTCVGPNICRCRNGWQGRACTVSYCNRFSSCKSCAMAVGCGWCDQRQSCESGMYRSPDVLPCNTWFYHSCFTVGEKGRCSGDIEVVDCEHRQCNNSLSTTTVESCLRCQDVEGCFKETIDGFCEVWNEDQCPKGFIHPLYNDTTRIEKILVSHNVEYVPLEGNILYRCPVRFSSWGATMFVNEGDLDIRIGQVLSSPQANGVLHKVEQVVKTDDYTVIVAHPATPEDMLDYSDFSQEVQLEMAVDMKRNEGVPELSVVERVLSGNGTLDESTVRVVTEDASVYKCIGARAMNGGEGSYHLLMRDIPDHLSVGDIIVSNHSNGILEKVTQQTTTPYGVFIQTQLQDCFTTFNFREELYTADGASLPASLPCSGGPDGAHGLLIVDSAGKEVDLETGDTVVGRKSGRVLAKVLDVTTVADFTLVEVEPILSRSTMTMPSRKGRREDATVSQVRSTVDIAIEDQFWGATDSYNIKLSTSGELSAGIKLSLAVSTSEFRTPTLKKAEASFIGGRVDVGLEGTLDVSESTQTRGGFRTVLSPSYVSLCVSQTVCIPGKIWADMETSYNIYAEGPGSIQMSSNVVKPDIHGGGSWQPQEGSQWFSFDQNEESGSADIVISSYSGTAADSNNLIILELKVKPTFFMEFPTSEEIEEEANSIPSLDSAFAQNGPGGAFGYSITTSLQSQALLRVSVQSCSAECPYSDRPQYVGVLSSLDYLKGAFNVIVGNNDYYQEQQWRDEWMDFDRDCRAQPSSIDTCTDTCPCPGGATGMPHPTNESFCMCPCDCPRGNISFTHPDIPGDGCNCDVCPDGDFKTVNSQGHLHCPCLCPDNSTSELTSTGKCDCSCNCADGSRDVVMSDGSCPCRCTCNNCHESVLGPQGCICSDRCPDCENDEEPEWQDCVCKCPQKTECGIPPTCVVGRRGPDCRQPDCRPCQDCSGNGRCFTSTDSCQSSCVCWPQWFGDCCELRRPRPIGGDPHLQTLDGKSYDFHGIGEFWDCKSVANDFGVQTRMYAYERASLIGGVAVKAGYSVVTMMTLPNATEKDVPDIRIDGELCQLSVGEKYLLNNGTIHLLAQQPSTNATESGAVIIVSVTFASGATVSFDVRYSPKMGRQFVNILFSPTATFKGSTEGLCGIMDDDDANDFTGPDGAEYNDSSVFAETWRINKTHHGSGLMGSWSWNSSNFHPDDVMDPAYSDPTHRPSTGIDGLTLEEKGKAEEMCIALGLTGTLLNECIFDVSITNDTTFTEQEVFKGCPNQCSGRGCCINGTCDCITGWSGEDCNLGNCTDCSEDHGKCELGFCRCEPGWEGAACDQKATCHAVNNCTSMDHGICVSTDVCRCKPGYIGDDCSKVPTCGNVANCTDHGVCVDYDICLCDEQWTGDKCDQFSCAALDHCSGHGHCVDIDVCYCDQGWTGSSCVTPDCPAVNQCSRQGDCISPNICQCYSGYQSLNCSQAQSCPEFQECHENGACVMSSEGLKECRCFPGFSGTSCGQPDCTKQNDCSQHGTCIEPNLCQCDRGYTGHDCTNFSCEALRYCSGHGSCMSFDTCSCDPGWSGRPCNIANCSSKAECSGQGTCVTPNTCECFPGFQGDNCSEENVPNEHTPIFQHDRYDATIPENQPVGTTVITVYANDTDSGRNGEVRYRLVQTGLDGDNFAVHPTLGIITSVVEFDFESLENTSFSLIVEAYDQGVPTLTGTATITINVTDQNDNKPVINIPPDTEYNLQANSPTGFHVTTIQASDADRSDDNSKITYGIASASPFVSIAATNGSVTVNSALESGTYLVRVSATDHGSPPKSDEISLRMIVTSVSTNTAPQCPEDQSLEIPSQSLTRGSTITTIEAEDHDNGPNGDVSYSFKSQTGDLASLFDIHPSTGRIYVASDVPQLNDTFSAVAMTVEVRDNAVDSMSCETNVIVVITPPEFSGTVPNNVFPATTPLTTTAEPQTTLLDRSTAGSTTQLNITTEELESTTTLPTTEKATYFDRSTTGSTPQLDITTEELENTTTGTLPTTEEATYFDRSTTGSTTKPDITTEESDSSVVLPTATTDDISMVVEARLFRGVLKLVNREWKDELRHQISDAFKALAAEVEQELGNVFGNSDLGDTYDSVEVTGFSPGSIKVDFMVRFHSPTPIASDTVLAVLSGRTNIGGLQIDGAVTSITDVTGDESKAAWYDNPIYISVICVGAAVVVTAIVVLVICCARKRRHKTMPADNHWPFDNVPMHNQWPSDNAQRLVQQNLLVPLEKVSREPARQTYENPMYNDNE
ncbi:TNC [Branchiostoma lanceolatum]|uniref:TNC protein n=1 Tax=Branchiostoma lanceolatum TaxID=7740 RepID=A0A8J9YR63_BRALA|nr:TNC [Branchiostoma lanceolatum]